MRIRPSIVWTALLLSSLSAFAQDATPTEPTVEQPVVEEAPKTKPSTTKQSVRLVYPPSTCLNAFGDFNLSLVTSLVEHFKTNRGSVAFTSSGITALSDGPTFIFPENGNDPRTAQAAVDEQTAWELVEELPALASPYEVVFQYPFQGHFDWVSIIEKDTKPDGDFPDTKRVTAKLYRGVAGDKPVFKLELPDGKRDPVFLSDVLLKARVDAPDDSVEIVSLGRSLGRGVRVRPALDAAMKSTDDINIQLNLGGFADANEPEFTELCAELTGLLNPMATVPTNHELRLGPAALSDLAKRHRLRFVAANLLDAKSNQNIFRRFSVFEVVGLTVVVYGIVGEDQLDRLSTTERERWKVLDPSLALQIASEELEAQLQRKPDLTVVMLSTSRGGDLASIARIAGADIVIGPDTKSDLSPTKHTIEVSGEATRNRNAALLALGTPWGVNEIVARYSDKKLRQIEFTTTPIRDEGPLDVNVFEAFKPLDQKALLAESRVVVPALQPFLQKNEQLKELVFGEKVLIRGRYIRYNSDQLALFSDPMWMRVVTNSLRRQLDTDLAASRNLPRSGMMVGPLAQLFVKQWLSAADTVGVVTLSGREVTTLLDYIDMQNRGQVDASDFIFVSGAWVNKNKRRINGREIDPDDPYDVAVTDHLVSMAPLRKIFSGKTIEWQTTNDERDKLTDVVMRELDGYADETGNFDPNKNEQFETLLTDDGTTLATEYKLEIKELSIRSALYRNSSNVATFAESRETRLLTPNNFLLGGVADLFYQIDGRNVGWTIGSSSSLDRVTIETPNGTQESERADDLLLYTQFDINAVKVNVSEVGMPLVPFVRGEFDSEFTATPNPAVGPDAKYPHQKVINTLVGVVLYPGKVLREIRFAPIARIDLSESSTRTDFGARLGYDLAWRIAGPLTLESATSVEYFIPDDDDRASDLALRLVSKTQLVMPIWRSLSFFAFADLFYAIGATPVNDSFGGSILTGGGLRFSDVWRF